MERERDEREETARLVLLLAEAQKVVDTLLVRLDVPVEHGALRRDAEPVRRVVHVEPVLRRLLAGSDQRTYTVGEDLCAAAGHRTETCVLQNAQDFLVRAPLELRHVMDLGGRIELEMHV